MREKGKKKPQVQRTSNRHFHEIYDIRYITKPVFEDRVTFLLTTDDPAHRNLFFVLTPLGKKITSGTKGSLACTTGVMHLSAPIQEG